MGTVWSAVAAQVDKAQLAQDHRMYVPEKFHMLGFLSPAWQPSIASVVRGNCWAWLITELLLLSQLHVLACFRRCIKGLTRPFPNAFCIRRTRNFFLLLLFLVFLGMNCMQPTNTLPGRFWSYLDLKFGMGVVFAIVPTPSDLWCPQFTCYLLLVCSDLFPFAYCPLLLCFYVQQVRHAVTVFPASRLGACAVRLGVHSAAARAVDLRPRG